MSGVRPRAAAGTEALEPSGGEDTLHMDRAPLRRSEVITYLSLGEQPPTGAPHALSARCFLRFGRANPTRKLLPTGVYSDVGPHGFGVYSEGFGGIRTFGHPGNCVRS